MPDLGLVQAFARYGAKLKNPQWSMCALAPNGDLVVSLWVHHHRKSEIRDEVAVIIEYYLTS
jgi:hypothetical protein